MTIIIIVYLLIFTFVLGTGMGIGWLLNWLFPEINFGVAILIGIISNAITLYFYFGVNKGLNEFTDEDDFLEEDAEEERSKIIPLRPIPTKRKKRKPR